MEGVIMLIGTEIANAYNSFISSLSPAVQNFLNIFFLILLITIYSIFIWKFYRFIATKNIIRLNLNQYNKSSSPVLTKILAGLFYFVEYIIILPFIIFFWFSIFTIFLIFLTEGIELPNIILLSAVIVGAIRMTAYYKEDLAKDLAKLIPFTLLAISMTKSGFFDFPAILSKFTQLPLFFANILSYLAIIIVLEIILRSFDLIFSLFGLEEEPIEESPEEENSENQELE